MATYQAYIDDSSSGNWFVLAGHIASADAWAGFTKEWQELLPYSVLDKTGQFNFKMSAMNLTAERAQRVPAFLNIMDKYIEISIYVAINIQDIYLAKARIYVHNINIEYDRKILNPYYIAFRSMLDVFHKSLNKEFKMVEGETVDFIFDEQSESNYVMPSWSDYVGDQVRIHGNKSFGSKPRFESDNKFLPLQAADCFAWIVRRAFVENRVKDIPRWVFPGFKRKRAGWVTLEVRITEDNIAAFFKKAVVSSVAGIVYDINFNSNNKNISK